ncbi:MAG: ATP synthase F0 subunit B [Thermodesulfobacteriota bacterium]|nr:ATP synthase F0 subunit B [Thermodesulfobacteriota bacterium]
MIEVNLTLLIQMVNFLLLVFLMNVILYRPIRRLVEQRNRFVSEQNEEISRAHAAVQEVIRQYEDRIREARSRGREKIQDLKEAAYQAEKDIIGRASREAAGQVQQVRQKVERELGAVRRELQAQIEVFSRELAQRILGRAL